MASLRQALARRYAEIAFGLAAPAYAFLTGHQAWRDSCRALGDLVPGPRVLDVGVGPGGVAAALARGGGARLHVGLDRSTAMLRRAARAGGGILLLRADAAALPVREGAFDGATLHSVLYLLPDPDRALGELRRVLRPGGRIALLEPRAGGASLHRALAMGWRCGASMALWRTMSGVHARHDEASLAALLGRAGFCGARAWPVLAGYGVVAAAERGA
ncbi:MAG TPA: methyltransferase domain-containing protein [Anaeromyxobacteraceae bacterium]|jgi:ubiquinone/menaquinone biosynthesis C-methylase UbiE